MYVSLFADWKGKCNDNEFYSYYVCSGFHRVCGMRSLHFPSTRQKTPGFWRAQAAVGNAGPANNAGRTQSQEFDPMDQGAQAGTEAALPAFYVRLLSAYGKNNGQG